MRIELARGEDLAPSALVTARALLDQAFADMTGHDWEHTLGGLHALAWEGDHLVGHGSLVPRRLRAGHAWVTAGYVEGLAVHPDRRRRGYGATLMDALEAAARPLYPFTALSTTDDALPFYLARGWLPWHGPTGVLTDSGVRPTPQDDGGVLVLPGPSTALDRDLPLVCEWRAGDVW